MSNRVWVSDGSGSAGRTGLVAGGTRRGSAAWSGCLSPMPVSRLSRSRRPGACIGRGYRAGASPSWWLRVFAPSETKAARMQLGSGRFKTDDRDCAALTYLARQGAGRAMSEEVGGRGAAGCGTSSPRSGRATAERPAAAARPAQRLVPGSVGAGRSRSGRIVPIETPTGLGGAGLCSRLRRPTAPTQVADRRAPGQLTKATAGFWVSGGATACRRHPTRTHAPTAGPRPGPLSIACRPTSPPSRRRSSACSRAPMVRS